MLSNQIRHMLGWVNFGWTSMARERPEGVFVVGKAVCPCTVCLLPSQGTSFKFADLAPHSAHKLTEPSRVLSTLWRRRRRRRRIHAKLPSAANGLCYANYMASFGRDPPMGLP